MTLLLVAGPSLAKSPVDMDNLTRIVRRALAKEFVYDPRLTGVVLASDTITGTIAINWCKGCGYPYFEEAAFKGVDELRQLTWNDETRGRIVERNARMLRWPDIARMTLFMGTNECIDFVAWASHGERPIEISRIMT
jgi:hypothetical protein